MTQEILIDEIFTLMPHRYPFLLLDRVLEYKEFDYVHAIKNVTINEPYFNGHFPGKPVMPGVLILEALAQASVILSNVSRKPPEGFRFMYYFAGIDNAKFKYIVTPGDQLLLKASLQKSKGAFWFMHGEAYVGEHLACTADLMCATKEEKL